MDFRYLVKSDGPKNRMCPLAILNLLAFPNTQKPFKPQKTIPIENPKKYRKNPDLGPGGVWGPFFTVKLKKSGPKAP